MLEKEIINTNVFGKGCIGCLAHKKDIMIAYNYQGSDDIVNLYLTTEQAKNLLDNLKKQLKNNKFCSCPNVDVYEIGEGKLKCSKCNKKHRK